MPPPSQHADLQQTFFFDLPLSDVYGTGCSALGLIYHGSEEGVFGKIQKKAVDLHHVEAFQISLKHRTVQPLSDDYEYYLVYYRKGLAVRLWNRGGFRGCPTLRSITRRVKYSSKQSISPNRLRALYVKSGRPVHIAQYMGGVPTDHCVPSSYIEEFDSLFEGFLMRCKRGYPLITRLFHAQGLSIVERRDVTFTSNASTGVHIYTDGES